MAREGLTRDDIAGLLLHLGKDCPGALSVLAVGAPAVKVPGDFATDYTALSDERLTAIAAALQERRRLPAGTMDPSPLAGVQSKLALTRLPDGRLAEPIAGTERLRHIFSRSPTAIIRATRLTKQQLSIFRVRSASKPQKLPSSRSATSRCCWCGASTARWTRRGALSACTRKTLPRRSACQSRSVRAAWHRGPSLRCCGDTQSPGCDGKPDRRA